MTRSAEYPIQEVREMFPALKRTYRGKQAIYFDGPGGSQVVGSAIEAMAGYMLNGTANTGGQYPTAEHTHVVIADARQAIADLFGARPNEVAFGQNMTSMAYAVSRALSRDWDRSGEIVVSQMDHQGNIDPWRDAAADRGMNVRWLKVDTNTLTLDLSSLNEAINDRTRLVAVGLASNAIGTINDVPRIAARAREVGAIMAVDVVHAAPHILVDRDQLGADILLCSAYKFFGPHVGMAVIREEVFQRMNPYRLEPAAGYAPPDKLETGTQNFEALAGVKPAVEFFASLGSGSTTRERIVSGYACMEEHENALADRIRSGLEELPGVTLYQAKPAVRKTPTVAFQVAGVRPDAVCRWLSEKHAIFAGSEDFYATTLARVLGVSELGGWVRVGMAPYSTEEEVDVFLTAMSEYTVKVGGRP